MRRNSMIYTSVIRVMKLNIFQIYSLDMGDKKCVQNFGNTWKNWRITLR
jgi:hypothetical protein